MCFSTGYFYPLYLAVGSQGPSSVGTEGREGGVPRWGCSGEGRAAARPEGPAWGQQAGERENRVWSKTAPFASATSRPGPALHLTPDSGSPVPDGTGRGEGKNKL